MSVRTLKVLFEVRLGQSGHCRLEDIDRGNRASSQVWQSTSSVLDQRLLDLTQKWSLLKFKLLAKKNGSFFGVSVLGRPQLTHFVATQPRGRLSRKCRFVAHPVSRFDILDQNVRWGKLQLG